MDVVTVLLDSSSRAVTCHANGHDLEVGAYCVVETEAGTTMARVLAPTWDNPAWDARRDKLGKVLRPADRRDEENLAYSTRREESIIEDARRRIADKGLPMRLTGVRFSPDRTRITFYFTAEGRVDFRALVRELASAHRARIEMRQIGARDEAKVRGGMGHCGRPLCCSTWLPAFQPVSIRNAKAQGLSLSPSKISGMCGRLMCCLRYELGPDGKPLPGAGCGGGNGGCGRRSGNGRCGPDRGSEGPGAQVDTESTRG